MIALFLALRKSDPGPPLSYKSRQARWIVRDPDTVRYTMSVRQNIKVAIAGVGNCAGALVQGVEYYRDRQGAALKGVMRHSIGGYLCGEIGCVPAVDQDP